MTIYGYDAWNAMFRIKGCAFVFSVAMMCFRPLGGLVVSRLSNHRFTQGVVSWGMTTHRGGGIGHAWGMRGGV